MKKFTFVGYMNDTSYFIDHDDSCYDYLTETGKKHAKLNADSVLDAVRKATSVSMQIVGCGDEYFGVPDYGLDFVGEVVEYTVLY